MEQTYVISFKDLCIEQVEVTVEDDFIVECVFTGGCRSNLRVLRNNLIGEPIDQAYFAILANCCEGVKQKCVKKLKDALEKQFRAIAEGRK